MAREACLSHLSFEALTSSAAWCTIGLARNGAQDTARAAITAAARLSVGSAVAGGTADTLAAIKASTATHDARWTLRCRARCARRRAGPTSRHIIVFS